MQFATLTVLLATALAVSASPVSEKRQMTGTPRVYARFFRTNDCGPPESWAEDTVFIQNETVGLAGCQDFKVGPFASSLFDVNNFSRTGKSSTREGRRENANEMGSSLLQPPLRPTYFYYQRQLHRR
jgi:hypothetical protein